jgi:hypothetical protein
MPGVDAGAPERVDVRRRRRRERDVEPGRGGAVGSRLAEREVVPLDEVVAAVGRLKAELAQDTGVELLGGVAVAHVDPDVVEHLPR